MAQPIQIMVAYDTLDEAEAADAYTKSAHVKIEWKPKDAKFFFNRLENAMRCAGIKKQWTKLQTLATNLPADVQDEIKSFLRLQEDEAGNTCYKEAKTTLKTRR